MKLKMKSMHMEDMDEDDMEEMEDEEDESPKKKGYGKKALEAALMERMLGKKKHSPRCKCAKCAKKG